MPGAPGDVTDWVVDGVNKAINAFFKGLVTAALNPLLDLLGNTLLTTPTPGELPQIGEVWTTSWHLVLASYAILIMIAGLVVMSHESVQTRYSVKEIAPRIPLGFLAAALSLLLASKAIKVANALSGAVMGEGLDENTAGKALREFIMNPLEESSSIFLIILGLVLAGSIVALLVTYVVRVALTYLLIAGAPLALMFHALPQTDGVARWWWKSFGGVLAIQVAQSLALVVGVRILLDPDNTSWFGTNPDGLVNLIVALALMYILVRIPVWILNATRVGGGRSLIGGLARRALFYHGFRLLRGHGGGGGRGGGGGPPGTPPPAVRRRHPTPTRACAPSARPAAVPLPHSGAALASPTPHRHAASATRLPPTGHPGR